MNDLLFWLLMPYILTFCFIVGFMAYVPAPVVADGWVSKPRGGWVI